MKQFENFETMFSQSIGLSEPWHISGAEYDGDEGAVHIQVAARKTSEYPCPECGTMCARYDDEENERTWRHGDVVFFPCYVHCRRPRVKCQKHGIRVVTAPWARKNSRYTLLFEAYAMLLVEAMPVENSRKLLRISHTSLTRILRYWVNKALDADDLSKTRLLCVDETSFKRGQSYVTVVTDAEARRVIDVEEGRDAAAVEAFSYRLEQQGGDCNKIEQVACDMSSAYLSGIETCFPESNIVIDRFHVKKLMLEALDKVRRDEQGQARSRRRDAGRKLLMIPERKMTAGQLEKTQELCREYPKTGRAFRMVQSLDLVYQCRNVSEAEDVFDKLFCWLRRSRLQPMKDVALTLKKHKDRILAYFIARLTNAIAEGINSLIQAAKRKARGYRTFEGYRCMIFLAAGRLKLDTPPLFV